jgi:hypothetical protein
MKAKKYAEEQIIAVIKKEKSTPKSLISTAVIG